MVNDVVHLSSRLLSFILFWMAAGSVAIGWQDTRDRTPSPVPETDTVSENVRRARDRMFAAVLFNFPSQLSQSPGTPFPIAIVEKLPMLELPVAQAQTIAIGQIIGLTPRVTPGSQGVYTEYHVAAGTVLMNSSTRNGNIFDLVILGGFARMPDGRVLGDRVMGAGTQIEAGNTYLMFLHYVPSGDCFSVVKLWEIRNGIAVATARDDLARVSKNTSAVDGMPVEEIVNRLQADITALKQ
jgi:hypothetical protein